MAIGQFEGKTFLVRKDKVLFDNPISELIKELEALPEEEKKEAKELARGLNSDASKFLFENKDSL